MFFSHPRILGMSAERDTLIVFTTCNHIEMTVLALEYLKHSLETADLIVVDDFSIDGTGNCSYCATLIS